MAHTKYFREFCRIARPGNWVKFQKTIIEIIVNLEKIAITYVRNDDTGTLNRDGHQ